MNPHFPRQGRGNFTFQRQATKHSEYYAHLLRANRNIGRLSFGGPFRRNHTFFFDSVDALWSGVASGSSQTLITLDFTNYLKANDPNNISTYLLPTFPSSITPISNFQTRARLQESIVLLYRCRRSRSLRPPAMFLVISPSWALACLGNNIVDRAELLAMEGPVASYWRALPPRIERSSRNGPKRQN